MVLGSIATYWDLRVDGKAYRFDWEFIGDFTEEGAVIVALAVAEEHVKQDTGHRWNESKDTLLMVGVSV